MLGMCRARLHTSTSGPLAAFKSLAGLPRRVMATAYQQRAPQHTSTDKFDLGGVQHLAYRYTAPSHDDQPCVVFIHGLCSNMTGTKAAALERHAVEKGYACLCFDTRGHGSSSGTFEGTHIGDWYQDCETALLHLAAPKKRILVGSSLGGWLALQLALKHPHAVAGLALIAPALDFTERIWESLNPQQQAQAQQEGRVPIESNYMEPVYAGIQLIEQGKRFLMLDKLATLQVACPIRILHGVQDDAVPVEVAKRLFEELPAQDMALTLVKDGDHRLARPQDIRMLLNALDELVECVTLPSKPVC